MWAHVIHSGKHTSIDEPPDKPFWRGRKRKLSEQPQVGYGISPTKKVSVRSELLDQLSKWHKLSEAGVVSSSEYDELKQKILSDIKEL